MRGTRQNKINTRSLGIIICIYAIIIIKSIKIRKNTCLLSANGKKLPFQLAKGTPGTGTPNPGGPTMCGKGEFGICVTFRPVVYHHICSTHDSTLSATWKNAPTPRKGKLLEGGNLVALSHQYISLLSKTSARGETRLNDNVAKIYSNWKAH